MVCSGYMLYGSANVLVLHVQGARGVNGFVLNSHIGEFVQTEQLRDIRIPSKGKIYSVNEGNYKKWDAPTQAYVDMCRGSRSLRYVGSMVSDVHRTLLYGGVFMYPQDSKSKRGKLRYLYEVSPMSMLVEQAGGASFCPPGFGAGADGSCLDVQPSHIHERLPIFIGSADDIAECRTYFKE